MSAYVLDLNGLQLFDVKGSTAPPAPGEARTVDGLQVGDYEIHGTGLFIFGPLDSNNTNTIVSDKRACYGGFHLPRLVRWSGGTFAISAMGGADIVVTITPILWGPG